MADRSVASAAGRGERRSLRATAGRAHRRRKRFQLARPGGGNAVQLHQLEDRRRVGCRAGGAHGTDRCEARCEPTDASAVAHALVVLALHQRALPRVDRRHDRCPRNCRALRARGVPIRHRPCGSLRAAQQGRSSGRESAPRRDGAPLVADAPHAVALFLSPVLSSRTTPRSRRDGDTAR